MRAKRMWALALGMLFVLPAVASAKRPATITDGYARRLVTTKVQQQVGRYRWRANLIPGGSRQTKMFNAKVNWGKGPHIMIAVPNVMGTVNVAKTKNAPRGLDRVKIFERQVHPARR